MYNNNKKDSINMTLWVLWLWWDCCVCVCVKRQGNIVGNHRYFHRYKLYVNVGQGHGYKIIIYIYLLSESNKEEWVQFNQYTELKFKHKWSLIIIIIIQHLQSNSSW